MPYADPKSRAAKECRRRAAKKYYDKNQATESKRGAEWCRNNRPRVRALAAARRSTGTPAERVLYNNAKNRAKAQGLEFNLTYDDVLMPERCPVLGIPLAISTGCAKDGSPSVDRLDPTKGYIRGNVMVISHRANTLKSNGTYDELLKVLAYMEAIPRVAAELAARSEPRLPVVFEVPPHATPKGPRITQIPLELPT